MHATLSSPPTFSENSHLASAWQNGNGRFLIDGFPRQMDQALEFDASVRRLRPPGTARSTTSS